VMEERGGPEWSGKDWGLGTASLLVPFGFAELFFARWLFRDYEVRGAVSVAVQFLFAATFALSVNMQLLLIFEIMGMMDASSRRWLWQLDLNCLVALLTAVLPISFFWSVLRSRRRIPQKIRLILVFLAYALFLVVYDAIGAHVPTLYNKANGDEGGLLSIRYSVGRLGLLGVAAMAILSGFGAINSPYMHLTIFLRPFSDKEIDALELRALQTLNQIASKKKKLKVLDFDLRRVSSTPSSQSTSGSSGLWNRFKFWVGSSPNLEEQVAYLKKEIKSLEEFHQELFLDVSEMHMNRERLHFSRTMRGFVHFMLGYVFSGYCVYKCFLVTINILFQRDPTNDPVTRGFEIFLMLFNVEIDVSFWSQLISLILVGVLVFASVRGFLITIAKIFHQISTSISSHSVVLLLGQIMGMYFISFVLMMRMNLPEDYREVVTEVLGVDMQFNFFHRFFDRIFLASAIATTVALYVLHIQRIERTKMHSFDDKSA